MPRSCLFCGRTPTTREHVWPEWFVKEHAQTPIAMERTGGRPLTLPRSKLELVVRGVCEHCNNGWMSRIEDAAMPMLSPMIRGASVTLNATAQTIVTSWAVKTVMLLEHTLGLPEDRIYYRPSERAFFRQPPHVPPEETTVLIAALRESRVVSGLAGVSDLFQSNDEKVGHWSCATLSFGSLVLQVQSDRYTEETGRKMIVLPGPHYSRTEWIWPILHATVNFPPYAPLTPTEFDEFVGSAPDPRSQP